MTSRVTGATARRVLRQLRRDPRTIALLVLVPCLLVFLVDQLFADRPQVFQQVGVPLLGLFPLISMFLVTSITMLRERQTGTLERLLSLPVAKLDLLVGYALAFAVVAAVQATVVCDISRRRAASTWVISPRSTPRTTCSFSSGLLNGLRPIASLPLGVPLRGVQEILTHGRRPSPTPTTRSRALLPTRTSARASGPTWWSSRG